ncbi:MAG: bifunctional adenosylcobinamide kinase/adenosylcobinamide-phosphate guanylyltransferase [Deltaproteobacteria bacterium]|nr:bifunctional adenosylcobinamide kinase/adenosylcobinamide-phosphate guanylyltransferase [Deltaproteobacteria bacterium]
MNDVILVTGGARSGKSRHALALAETATHRAFVATAQPVDDEMRQRIEKHRAERPKSFVTVEEPLDLAGALRRFKAGTEIAIVDCLTVWLGNLMHVHGPAVDSFQEVSAFLDVIEAPPCRLIVVTNEVGMGLVPENGMARRFRDLAGQLNQEVARRADSVLFMVCGIPLQIKPERGQSWSS